MHLSESRLQLGIRGRSQPSHPVRVLDVLDSHGDHLVTGQVSVKAKASVAVCAVADGFDVDVAAQRLEIAEELIIYDRVRGDHLSRYDLNTFCPQFLGCSDAVLKSHLAFAVLGCK